MPDHLIHVQEVHGSSVWIVSQYVSGVPHLLAVHGFDLKVLEQDVWSWPTSFVCACCTCCLLVQVLPLVVSVLQVFTCDMSMVWPNWVYGMLGSVEYTSALSSRWHLSLDSILFKTEMLATATVKVLTMCCVCDLLSLRFCLIGSLCEDFWSQLVRGLVHVWSKL